MSTEMKDWSPSKLLKPVLEHPYAPDVCFICASPLSTDTATAEHVVPKWIQDRFELRNQRITLVNGTTIPYRQLTVPCCFDCNNRVLSPLENRISAAFSQGFDAVANLPRIDVFRWIAKIFLGMQFKELAF